VRRWATGRCGSLCRCSPRPRSICVAGFFARAVKLGRQSAIKNVVHQRGLTRPGDPVITVITPSGKVTSRFWRLFPSRREWSAPPLLLARSARISICTLPGDVCSGQRVRIAQISSGVPVRHQTGRHDVRRGAKIDPHIGGRMVFFVMLPPATVLPRSRRFSERGKQAAMSE